MAVRINGVDYNSNLRLRGLEGHRQIEISRKVAFDGTVYIDTMPGAARRQLALEALRSTRGVEGYWSLAEIETVNALVAAGQPVSVEHDRGSFTVLLVGFTELAPVIDYRDPGPATKYTGTLNMQEV
jgi:hypothetical protein